MFSAYVQFISQELFPDARESRVTNLGPCAVGKAKELRRWSNFGIGNGTRRRRNAVLVISLILIGLIVALAYGGLLKRRSVTQAYRNRPPWRRRQCQFE